MSQPAEARFEVEFASGKTIVISEAPQLFEIAESDLGGVLRVHELPPDEVAETREAMAVKEDSAEEKV